MTRILPASGAGLAHYFPNRGDRGHHARTEQSGAAREQRHFGNRRMGDRRGDARRGTGRRQADRLARQAGPNWISTSISAHLIGQAEPVTISAHEVRQAYTAQNHNGKPHGGGLV